MGLERPGGCIGQEK